MARRCKHPCEKPRPSRHSPDAKWTLKDFYLSNRMKLLLKALSVWSLFTMAGWVAFPMELMPLFSHCVGLGFYLVIVTQKARWLIPVSLGGFMYLGIVYIAVPSSAWAMTTHVLGYATLLAILVAHLCLKWVGTELNPQAERILDKIGCALPSVDSIPSPEKILESLLLIMRDHLTIESLMDGFSNHVLSFQFGQSYLKCLRDMHPGVEWLKAPFSDLFQSPSESGSGEASPARDFFWVALFSDWMKKAPASESTCNPLNLVWLRLILALEWFQNPAKPEWVRNPLNSEWIRAFLALEWFHNRCNPEWIRNILSSEWLQTAPGSEWLSDTFQNSAPLKKNRSGQPTNEEEMKVGEENEGRSSEPRVLGAIVARILALLAECHGGITGVFGTTSENILAYILSLYPQRCIEFLQWIVHEINEDKEGSVKLFDWILQSKSSKNADSCYNGSHDESSDNMNDLDDFYDSLTDNYWYGEDDLNEIDEEGEENDNAIPDIESVIFNMWNVFEGAWERISSWKEQLPENISEDLCKMCGNPLTFSQKKWIHDFHSQTSCETGLGISESDFDTDKSECFEECSDFSDDTLPEAMNVFDRWKLMVSDLEYQLGYEREIRKRTEIRLSSLLTEIDSLRQRLEKLDYILRENGVELDTNENLDCRMCTSFKPFETRGTFDQLNMDCKSTYASRENYTFPSMNTSQDILLEKCNRTGDGGRMIVVDDDILGRDHDTDEILSSASGDIYSNQSESIGSRVSQSECPNLAGLFYTPLTHISVYSSEWGAKNGMQFVNSDADSVLPNATTFVNADSNQTKLTAVDEGNARVPNDYNASLSIENSFITSSEFSEYEMRIMGNGDVNQKNSDLKYGDVEKGWAFSGWSSLSFAEKSFLEIEDEQNSFSPVQSSSTPSTTLLESWMPNSQSSISSTFFSPLSSPSPPSLSSIPSMCSFLSFSTSLPPSLSSSSQLISSLSIPPTSDPNLFLNGSTESHPFSYPDVPKNSVVDENSTQSDIQFESRKPSSNQWINPNQNLIRILKKLPLLVQDIAQNSCDSRLILNLESVLHQLMHEVQLIKFNKSPLLCYNL